MDTNYVFNFTLEIRERKRSAEHDGKCIHLPKANATWHDSTKLKQLI
jgi:hypothetical protein